ncbi:MAG: alpha/beta fold hydrolase, partial [Firmicutes bacterium]|nr:alpha/beta fold hydrolase [Bacillota bacterium]
MAADNIKGRSFLKKFCDMNIRPQLSFNGSTAEEFNKWQEETVKKLEKILCFDKIADCELSSETVETADLKTKSGYEYSRTLLNIDTADGLTMPVYVLEPKHNGNGVPVIALHCHGSDGKNGIVGIIHKELENNSGRFSFTYALDLLEKGYTVFCPDILGSGVRKSVRIDKIKDSDCNILNFTLMAMGLNLQGVITWELKKLADYIQTLGLDMDKLTCVGFSGGGLQTLWLAALDKRIKTAYVSGY